MEKKTKPKLGEILIEKGSITAQQLNKALSKQKETGEKLGYTIIKLNFTTEDDIAKCLSEQLGYSYANLNNHSIDPDIIKLIPEHIARRYVLIPLEKKDNILTLAMSDPENLFATDEVKKLGYKIKMNIAPESSLRAAIEKYYGSDLAQKPKTTEIKQEENAVELVNKIINEGVQKRASDIHIEPQQDRLRVRYRIDGVLYEAKFLDKTLLEPIIARIKVISDLDIAEKRVPQDGRFRTKYEEREIDFRVAISPTYHGEKANLRILDKVTLILEPEKLGFEEQQLKIFKECIAKPHGMILITGPTGSGKTTTLYSALHIINKPEKNIVTIEDPIEYELEGINQMQVKPKIGLDFANGLRSIVRQDPNVIMVGEIRDKETAEIAIQAALTGHLVFSTLHTMDSAGAVARLYDMGVEPFLIASSITMIGAQRLVREICDNCKEPYTLTQEVMKDYNLKDDKFYKGKGCDKCKDTGYYGRTAVIETFVVNDRIGDLITSKATAQEIKKAAIEAGMKTLRENGIEKVKRAITTLEEVLRVTA